MKRIFMKSMCVAMAIVAVLGNVTSVEARSQSDSKWIGSAILTGVSTIERSSGKAYSTLSERGSATVRSEYKYYNKKGILRTVNQDTTTGGGRSGGAWNFSLDDGCRSKSIRSVHAGGYNGASGNFKTYITW